jgi:hypothetical protein
VQRKSAKVQRFGEKSNVLAKFGDKRNDSAETATICNDSAKKATKVQRRSTFYDFSRTKFTIFGKSCKSNGLRFTTVTISAAQVQRFAKFYDFSEGLPRCQIQRIVFQITVSSTRLRIHRSRRSILARLVSAVATFTRPKVSSFRHVALKNMAGGGFRLVVGGCKCWPILA